MFDPFCADCPPMPPDDPTAHELMHCVDNKRGWPFWHDNGDTANVENPAWPAYLEFNDRGVAGRSASTTPCGSPCLNSPDYQQNLEELYLSALDVSFERFRFDVQGFAGYRDVLHGRWPRRRGGGNRSSVLEANTFSNGRATGRCRSRSPPAASWWLALPTRWSGSSPGPDDYSHQHAARFRPVPAAPAQCRPRPGAGAADDRRAGALGQRAGDGAVPPGRFTSRSSPAATPATAPAAAAASSARRWKFRRRLGGVGFGRRQAAAVAVGGGAAAAAPRRQAGGYMGLLQDQQEIRNQEDNVERLRSTCSAWKSFSTSCEPARAKRAWWPTSCSQDLQVAQARQALLNAESRLINSRNAYQATLDTVQGHARPAAAALPGSRRPDARPVPAHRPVTMAAAAGPGPDRRPTSAQSGCGSSRTSRRKTVPDPADPLRTRVDPRPRVVSRARAGPGRAEGQVRAAPRRFASQLLDRLPADDRSRHRPVRGRPAAPQGVAHAAPRSGSSSEGRSLPAAADSRARRRNLPHRAAGRFAAPTQVAARRPVERKSSDQYEAAPRPAARARSTRSRRRGRPGRPRSCSRSCTKACSIPSIRPRPARRRRSATSWSSCRPTSWPCSSCRPGPAAKRSS